MPAATDQREAIAKALAAFADQPLRQAATGFLVTLGYRSERTVNLVGSSPQAFLEFVRTHAGNSGFSESKALCSDWKSADLLFQLTDEELSGHTSLFKETGINAGLLKSYLFFAIELSGDHYARGKLTGIARQINRVFPMPVMVLIKHLADKRPVLSIAVINRRQHKRDAARDVLGKVTIIRDISLAEPHRGHLDILASFAVPNLVHPQRLPINSFDALHTAWEEIFNVELLNKRFYRELANWYFWALPQVEFPADIEKDDEKRRATGLIRLLTRLIFCWFIKEKGLVPEKLFVEAELKHILKDLAPDSSTYHQAILQNLFFATLNQRMGKDKNGKPYRTFARDEGFLRNRETYGVDTLYRYEEHFRDSDTAVDHFADVPFLNGGLFECLDRTEEGTDKKLYLDGFSRNKRKRPVIPNRLFFADEVRDVDLSETYGDKKRKKETVKGLLRILHSYKFTIVENTPIDQEIALDPELLGKVFENLLASYNEETRTTARKQTGSFYTPRPIVEYMVDKSLKAHLKTRLEAAASPTSAKAAGGSPSPGGEGRGEGGPSAIETKLDQLFSYTEELHQFSEPEVPALLDAIHTCKILDPACGSGAFPMGMLQKLVYIIHKLDPDNARWKQLQIDAAAKIPDSGSRDAAIAAIERDFADNEDDYGRKLYLIENCLYGVDIQPIAIQISKLRFFISLVCDQRTNRSKKENHGIRPLPNLETKFVAADTLIGLPEMEQLALVDPKVHRIEAEIESLYHSHFAIQRRDQKLALQKKIKDLRKELGKLLAESLGSSKKAQHIADWDPFDPQAVADFFDPHWMFGRSLSDGFDVVVANPPYVVLSIRVADAERKRLFLATYEVAEYKCDLYALFIEAGVKLLNKSGILAYIVPNPWLTQKYFTKLRSFLLRSTRVLEIITIEPSVFEAAVVNNAILRVQNQAPQAASRIRVCALTNISEIGSSKRLAVEQSEWAKPPAYIFETRSLSADGAVSKTILSGCNRLESIARVSIGCQAYNSTKHSSDIIERRAFHSTRKDTPEHLLEIGGGQVSRYSIKVRPNQWIRYGEWLHDYRSPEWLVGPRVFVREITARAPRRICAAFTDAELAFYKTVLCVIPNERNARMGRFICALLNSSVLSFVYPYAANKFVTDTFPRISVADLKTLPVCEPLEHRVQVIATLVRILELDQGQPQSRQFFDDLIDACVMECYFREHMAERDLLFLDNLAPHLAAFDPAASETKQRDFLTHLHGTLNAPSSRIRNRLLRLTADSPDFLAVIKQEGKV